ncbi:carotenoid 1,2-hydratase [Deinococcus irradiatisoli]|uniref:Carotenoid 1,2-hydratase n=1 Tax=Deinococcus irradiatisoli TaxID=2202254 RepID=A0A2Z3JDU2_9DEIO|nr:lipocalin family protein [Deinococcus irradiatisoli]AWN23212.1 carotenoid 1,2-hydratase [Deinococcus irradiatisoli]
MNRLLLLAPLLLTACVPRAVAFDPARLPDPAALGPNNAATEWWYVSGYLPETKQAFHWAQFKVNYKGVPYFASHLAVTDLNTGKLTFLEEGRQDAKFSFPPLKVRQGDWTLTQSANTPAAPFALQAGPLQLTLTPLKGPVVHPPGYSGTPETGQLYYQSVTRLNVSGTIAGQPARGLAWLDHQWGDQQPGRAALWDWFGVHLSDGSDLMLYRVKTLDGRVVQLAGSEVGADGVAREVRGLTMTPNRQWTSPSGRTYALDWTVTSDRGQLVLKAANDDQELLSKTTSVAYWEGPVSGEGNWGGQAVQVLGMGEFVGGVLTKAEGGLFGAP